METEVRSDGKQIKISKTLFNTFLAIFLFMQWFLKIPCGIANSVDPDQTVPEGATKLNTIVKCKKV